MCRLLLFVCLTPLDFEVLQNLISQNEEREREKETDNLSKYFVSKLMAGPHSPRNEKFPLSRLFRKVNL